MIQDIEGTEGRPNDDSAAAWMKEKRNGRLGAGADGQDYAKMY